MGSVRPRGVRRRLYVSAESNKEIVRRLGVEPWEGKMGVIDEVVSPGYVGHDPAQPTLQGPDGIKGFITAYLAGFPDGRIAIEEQLAEGDVVATRWTGRGTHTGELMGIPPTGKQVTVSGITVSHLENGKVVEEWSNWDTLGMLQQLGVVPEMAAAPT